MSKRPKVFPKAGDRYGRLVVKEFGHYTPGLRKGYLCKCDCGNYVIAEASSLNSGNTNGCGCMRGVGSKGAQPTHGKSKERTYHIWQNMKARCTNPNRDNYKWYGGKGIKVCDRWLHSFENFLEDMGECPEGMELDRILSSENYHKDNCRWVTHQQNISTMYSSQGGDLSLTFQGLSAEQFDRLIDSIGRND